MNTKVVNTNAARQQCFKEIAIDVEYIYKYFFKEKQFVVGAV
jgi:hypothetical protein